MTRIPLFGRAHTEGSETVETALQRQQCEFDLDQVVDLLIYGAQAAWGDKEKRLTDRERHFFLRQGDILAAAVADLKKLLHHPDSAVRAERMRTLHEALGTATVLGRHVLDEPVAERLRTAPALKGKSAKKDQRAKVIMRLAKPYLQKHPTWASWRVAGEIREQVNELLELPMSQRGISNHIEQFRPPRKD